MTEEEQKTKRKYAPRQKRTLAELKAHRKRYQHKWYVKNRQRRKERKSIEGTALKASYKDLPVEEKNKRRECQKKYVAQHKEKVRAYTKLIKYVS